MDTGATCNVIPKHFLSENSKVRPTGKRISCANNGNMKCFGDVFLDIWLPGCVTEENFVVVDNNNMKTAIIGVRSMKKLGINMDLKNSRCIMNGTYLPFSSSVEKATTYKHQGNGKVATQ